MKTNDRMTEKKTKTQEPGEGEFSKWHFNAAGNRQSIFAYERKNNKQLNKNLLFKTSPLVEYDVSRWRSVMCQKQPAKEEKRKKNTTNYI